MKIIENIIDCYKHVKYTALHKAAIYKLENELDKKHTLRILLHDTDKIIMYVLLPFLGTDVIKKIHRKINKHHWFDRISELSGVHIREMVLDWESCHYTKPDKTQSAKEFCFIYKPELYPYMNEYFVKWKIDNIKGRVENL